MGYEPMNILEVIQSQKTTELLLDLKVNCILSSPWVSSIETATTISEVQEAADCLGADCMARYVDAKKMLELEVEPILQQACTSTTDMLLDNFGDEQITKLWNQASKAWQSTLQELSDETETERNIVVIGHPSIHIALICHSLKLTTEWMESFHLDAGSVSVIDFPDGPRGRGIVQCINYTAHLGRWSIPITRSVANDVRVLE